MGRATCLGHFHTLDSVKVVRKARKLYEDFHKFPPKKVGEFNPSFEIPREATFVGDAVDVMYRSDKLEPMTHIDEGWIDYIHEHKSGVKVYRTDQKADGPTRKVPKWIWGTKQLVRLGDSLGFTYRDHDGYEVEAGVREPLPELYATPNGKALLIVERKRKVVALIWGGKLDVEPRGIVN